MENVLEIEHLSLALPSKKGMIPILHDVNLKVGEGKIMGLVGESGSGKSMTAFAVTRLLPGGGKAELDGSIRLCGRQLLGLGRKSMEEVRGRDVSMIFQEPMTCLNPVFTIGTQMTDVIRTHEKISKEEACKKAVSLLEEVHIRNAEDVIHCYPYQPFLQAQAPHCRRAHHGPGRDSAGPDPLPYKRSLPEPEDRSPLHFP